MDHPLIVMKILSLKNVRTEINKIALKMIKSVEFEVADDVNHVLNHMSPGLLETCPTQIKVLHRDWEA